MFSSVFSEYNEVLWYGKINLYYFSEESFTFNLKSKKANFTPIETFPSDINSNYVEATICLPSRNKHQSADNSDVTDAGSAVESRDVAQLRKLGKRRACYVGENSEGKKLKDDTEEDLFW